MAIIFNQSKEYRDLSFLDIAQLTEDQAWQKLKDERWGVGEEVKCPFCEKWDKHYFTKPRKIWSCRNEKCHKQFSVTSGTPFEKHKLSLVKLFLIIYFFASEHQGLSNNTFHSQLGVSLKTVFHNVSKIREALYETNNLTPLTGIVHIDCAHFCGKPRRSNVRKKTDSYVVNNRLRNRKDAIVPDLNTHPELENIKKLKNRRILLTMSQCDMTDVGSTGSNRTICYVIRNEKASSIIPLIKRHVSEDAVIMTDFGSAFRLIRTETGIRHFAVNHSEEYMNKNGVSNNMAESFFSRIRRAEFGTYNGMRHQYFAFYSAEFVWRHDSKDLTLNAKFHDILKRMLSREPSKAFTNYNHGSRLGFEYVS